MTAESLVVAREAEWPGFDLLLNEDDEDLNYHSAA